MPVESSHSLMDGLMSAEIPVASSCGGDGVCGRCVVELYECADITPPNPLEQENHKKKKRQTNERL
ncbi:MAG: 2Fe-2S iron-sulfur cluster-binding protein, partial [Pseudomonadota bacterium]